MKRTLTIIAAAVLTIAVPAIAAESHTGAAAAKKAITGEVVDMGCYLGHAAHGEKHISCATKCLSRGMPIGLLTSSGTLYLVTLDHEVDDPYNSLKNMAGKTVTITGEVMNRNGIKAIEATSVLAAK